MLRSTLPQSHTQPTPFPENNRHEETRADYARLAVYRFSNVLRSPIRSGTMEIGSTEQAPTLGEHSQEILRGLGYSDSEIAGMAERKVTKVAGA